jgi:hypothetical protein
MVQNILRPSIRQPDWVRVARVAGRVRSCPGSLMAAALHVQDRDEVHVDADRHGGVATCQAAGGHHEVVRRRDAHAAELDRDRGGEVAGRLEGVDRLERVAGVAVVLGGTRAEHVRELLGDRHQAGAGVRVGRELDRHVVNPSSRRRRPARRW